VKYTSLCKKLYGQTEMQIHPLLFCAVFLIAYLTQTSSLMFNPFTEFFLPSHLIFKGPYCTTQYI